MERDYFIFKTQVSFGIFSDEEVDPASISEELQLKPNRSCKKGDTYIGKKTGNIYGTSPRTVWAIDTEWTYHEEETISHHIEYFKSILLPKIDIIKKYKEDKCFDVNFWIFIDSECAGIGLDLKEEELKFFHSLSNWVHFSLICKNEIGDEGS